ncbi:MAG TPA: hypothetical protein VIO32_10465 [Candidatus Baltobacteraceae bacterium]
MSTMAMKARLKAAAQKAKLPGESVKPDIIERSGETATVTVIFKKGHKSVEDVSHHGSWYTDEEKEKLLNATLKTLELRGKRFSSR